MAPDYADGASKQREAAMKSLYARTDAWSPYVLSILRIVVGLLFLEAGLSKVFGFPVPEGGLIGLSGGLDVRGGIQGPTPPSSTPSTSKVTSHSRRHAPHSALRR